LEAFNVRVRSNASWRGHERAVGTLLHFVVVVTVDGRFSSAG
jgi:hypothetical protein